MLTFRRSDCLELTGYFDSDYSGCPEDFKSTSGCIFMLAEGAVSWKSVKQTLTATSTMEAEYVPCYEATRQAIWLKNFIIELGVWRASLGHLLYIATTLLWYVSLVIIISRKGQSILTRNSCLLERRSRNFKHELSIFPQS